MARRFVDLIRPALPALARAIATPAVRGAAPAPEGDGTVWRPAGTARALVVYLTDAPAVSRWLAGSIATRVGALVLVLAAGPDAAAIRGSIDRALRRARDDGELSPDAPALLVAEGAAASAGLATAAHAASRLALLYPTGIDSGAAAGDDSPGSAARVPTTLIQARATGPDRDAVVELDRALRRAGTAVRETEYGSVDDGWARYPRLSSGSRRALDDLVAFLGRGIGETSTFEVIPGWDLH